MCVCEVCGLDMCVGVVCVCVFSIVASKKFVVALFDVIVPKTFSKGEKDSNPIFSCENKLKFLSHFYWTPCNLYLYKLIRR